MNRLFVFLLLMIISRATDAQSPSRPADYWLALTKSEKVAFINGAYGSASALKQYHQSEVKKQYNQDAGWIEPYYIQRYYDIVDEIIAVKVGYKLDIIADHMDALYQGYDNVNIPLIEALRIVSTAEDGDQQKANLYLLKAQKNYRP